MIANLFFKAFAAIPAKVVLSMMPFARFEFFSAILAFLVGDIV